MNQYPIYKSGQIVEIGDYVFVDETERRHRVSVPVSGRVVDFEYEETWNMWSVRVIAVCEQSGIDHAIEYSFWCHSLIKMTEEEKLKHILEL